SFFRQANDGIRDFHVTGVQTCALPTSEAGAPVPEAAAGPGSARLGRRAVSLRKKKASSRVKRPLRRLSSLREIRQELAPHTPARGAGCRASSGLSLRHSG